MAIYAEGVEGDEDDVVFEPYVPLQPDLPQPQDALNKSKLRAIDGHQALALVANRVGVWGTRTEAGWEIWRGEEKEGSIRLLTGV